MSSTLTLHPLFSDHAVLPRDVELPIFGRGVPGQPVKVSIGGRQATARADASGDWEVSLAPLPAGGPHTLSVSTASKQLFRRNIMMGDVWLASGQSNMEWPLADSSDAEAAIDAARYPKMRFFSVPRRGSLAEEEICDAHWDECSPATARAFSAVAFHFGRTLLDSIESTVGIIHASWGGTAIASWMPSSSLTGSSEKEALARLLAGVQKLTEPPAEEFHADTGNTGEARGWASPEFDDAPLPQAPVPGMWQGYGMAFNGAVWFRRWVDFPLSWASQKLRLELGAIDDHDVTYVNGVRVGGVGAENPDAWRTARRYVVPESVVRPGRNLIAIRVFDGGGNGGFAGSAGSMRVFPEGRPHEGIPLAGKWRCVVERQIPLPRRHAIDGDSMPSNECPAALFNGMIAPFTRMPVRGVIWYQGESDVDRAHRYRALFTGLIEAWRAEWGRADLPFLFVQLANFLPRRDDPSDDAWAELREAQAMALRLPATAMAVAADVGDADDIHPRDKKTVGERLALAALAVAYSRTIPYAGPLYAGHAIESGAIRIRFHHTEGGLRMRGGGGLLQGFAIAGSDRKFRWADARIEDSTLVVFHPAILAPVAVRYGWESNPLLSLENGVGLPAAPFRTDDWPGISNGRS